MIKRPASPADVINMRDYLYNIHHSPKWLLSLCSISLFSLCSCSVVIRSGQPESEPEVITGSTNVVRDLGIPPGHLPPPGYCRIWVPGTPPGHQSPPGDCGELRDRVPAGAWLLYRDRDNPEEIEVLEYDENRPSVVAVIHYFDASTGRYLRDASHKREIQRKDRQIKGRRD